MEKTFEHFRIEREGAVAVVTLDRPPVNAFVQSTYRQLHDIFANIRALESGTKVVILRGAGKHFCGGNDLDEFMRATPDETKANMVVVRRALSAMFECEVPVISAVRGVVVGTGIALAGSSDLIVAADDAKFGLPEIGLGVLGGAKHLSRFAPLGLVRRMHLTGELVGVDEIQPFGGIARVVPADEVDDAAMELATKIASHSAPAIRLAKRSLNAIEYLTLHDGYALEQRGTVELSGFWDSKEAVAAFVERRRPEYTDQ